MSKEKDLTFKQIMESNAYRQQVAIINIEIQHPRLVIDYSAFKKSKDEKLLLKKLRWEWKHQIRKNLAA